MSAAAMHSHRRPKPKPERSAPSIQMSIRFDPLTRCEGGVVATGRSILIRRPGGKRFQRIGEALEHITEDGFRGYIIDFADRPELIERVDASLDRALSRAREIVRREFGEFAS